MELAVSPQGHLELQAPAAEIKDRDDFAERLSTSRARGLLALAKTPALRSRAPSLRFWSDFVSDFMRRFCAHADAEPLEIPIEDERLADWAAARPPMPGGEYVDEELLGTLWNELTATVAREIQAAGTTPRRYIAQRFPRWAEAGKVHFHLAEAPSHYSEPFAFLATYTIRVPDKARIQHRPLGLAVKDSAGRGEQALLERLLAPIHEATSRSNFVRELLQHKNALYRMLPLSPESAYGFIRDIPALEEAGIICKVPEAWGKKRPPRAKVSVTVGEKNTKSRVGFEGLVDFQVGVAIGDETLTQDEIDTLLNAEGPLVPLRGRWIEVNRERLEKLLGQWQEAARTAGDEGMPLGQAMRHLAELETAPPGATDADSSSEDRSWCDVTASSALREKLAALQRPGPLGSKEDRTTLERHLRATLRPYQQTGVSWLRLLESLGLGGCLADDMGLGKTLQVISLLVLGRKSEISPAPPGPSLLVVPASLLGNWTAEIDRFAPELSYHVAHGSAANHTGGQTRPRELDGYDVVLTTYGMVTRQTWMREKSWHLVVADEAQAIKNPQTKQSKAVRSLNARSRFALTGTPVENNLTDLWSLFDFTCPGLLGSQRKFKEAVGRLESEAGDYTPLRRLISPYLLRRKKTDKTVAPDLPDKIEQTAPCYLTKKQATLYQKQVKKLAGDLEEQKEDMERKGTILGTLMKLKQICNHPSQFTKDDAYTSSHSGKFQKLAELCETIASRREKVLVFTQFRELTDVLAYALGQVFGRDGLVLHGGTAVKNRKTIVETFQKDEGPPFLVLSLKAGGTGLNLTAASHVIHFDRWWNPAVESQATDRAFRIGQRKNVMVHKLMCRGTIEEKIDAMIRDKTAIAEALTAPTADANLTELSNDELLDVLRLDIDQATGAAHEPKRQEA